MNKKAIASPSLGEQFLQVEHSSGLTILLCLTLGGAQQDKLSTPWLVIGC